MKKKIIVIFALLTVATLLFAACTDGPSLSDLQNINDMLKASYSTITLTVKTKTAVTDLNGRFVMKFDGEQTTVTYEYEKISTFEVGEDGSLSVPEGGYFITTESGEVVVRDGEIIYGDNTVELPDELFVSGFSFKQAFFRNATVKNALFEADVIKPQDFTGNSSLECTDMHVSVLRNVSAKSLARMDLTYTTASGAEVELNYQFTK